MSMSATVSAEQPGYMTPALARWRRTTDAPLLVVAIGSLPLLLLDLSRESLGHGDRVFLDLVNVIVLVAFAMDYAVELVMSNPRRQYAIHEWTSLLIVISQALAIVPAFAAIGFLRVLRGGRALRAFVVLARVSAIGGAAARDGRQVLRAKAGRFALSLAAFTWLTSAVAFTLVEDVGRNGRLSSFSDALWWSTETITTVGYGDVYPVTGVGRIIGGVTMLVGISSFAVVTAKFAEYLVTSKRTEAPSNKEFPT